MITTNVVAFNEAAGQLEPTEQAVVEYEIYRSVLRYAELEGYHAVREAVFAALKAAEIKIGKDS